MKPNYSNWDDDLPPDPQEIYQDLISTLERKVGFGLYFVQCTPIEADNFAQHISRDLANKKIALLNLWEPIEKFYEHVKNYVQGQTIDILLVKGLEYSLYKYEKRNFGEVTEGQFTNLTKVPPILNHLNQQRERFRDDFSFCFVFLLRSFSLNYLIHRAPDFFDWRSGVYDLPTTAELVDEESRRLIMEGDYKKYLELTPQQKIETMLEIQELLTEKYQNDSNKARLLFEMGNLLYSANEYETAITFYEQELKLQPDDHGGWCNHGHALFSLSRYEAAIVSYRQALKLRPDDPFCWYALGNCQRKLHRDQEAILSYNQAIKIKTDDHYFWYNRGNALRNIGCNEEAILSYGQAIKIKPDESNVWNNRGIALRSLGRYQEAVFCYDQALSLQPDDYYAWYNRGVALKKLKQNEAALLSYDQALKLKPDDHYSWNNRGNALEDLGHIEEAIFSYDQALKIKPDDQYAFYNKACCYAVQGKIQEALENLENAVSLKPEQFTQMAKADPDFDRIREDARFQALINKTFHD